MFGLSKFLFFHEDGDELGEGVDLLILDADDREQLKDDEELVVTFQQGAERIRVMEIFLASPQVAVLIGPDAQRSLTRVVAAVGMRSMRVARWSRAGQNPMAPQDRSAPGFQLPCSPR